MPKLRCDASKCIYNCEHYCAKSVIYVNDDLDAKKCESFSMQKYNECDYNTEFANMDSVTKYVSIECRAKSCDYNCNGMCISENVKISDMKDGNGKAKCETFSL